MRFLAGRSLVVFFDNCEHVIGQAAALAETLAGMVPGLRLIATSREPLGVPGEVLVPVGPLARPAAAELFADRAQAVRPGFTADGDARPVIDDICRRLDGLPLAVELAAARVRSLTLATLAERLDDRFRLLTVGARTALPRQQTLRAVVDWSYDLLFEDERRLFARLSVFVGGCGLDAAEAVCADDQSRSLRDPDRGHLPGEGYRLAEWATSHWRRDRGRVVRGGACPGAGGQARAVEGAGQ